MRVSPERFRELAERSGMVGVPDKGGGPVALTDELPAYFMVDDLIVRLDWADNGDVGAWNMVTGLPTPVYEPLTAGTRISEERAQQMVEEERQSRRAAQR